MHRLCYLLTGLALASPCAARQTNVSEADGGPWSAWPAPDLPAWRQALDALLTPASAAATMHIDGDYRVIESDGLPNHDTGRFPNAHNPNRIRRQPLSYRVPATPAYHRQTVDLGLWPFGVALNGVPFDPGAAEFWRGDPRSGWQYEAMGPAVDLGLDHHHAHVQPNGSYHYHGRPVGLLEHATSGDTPTLLGYAADGFPFIPRCFHGEPDRSFLRGPGTGPGRSDGRHSDQAGHPPAPGVHHRPPRKRQHGRHPGRRGPPPEAIEACAGRSAGDRASFTSPFGHPISGECRLRHGQLFLIPDHHLHAGSGGPPRPD